MSAVHASLATQRLVISVIDAVFVYSFSGEVIAAFKLEPFVQEHSFGGRIVASMSKPDWIYFAKLASDAQSLFIGAYSGALPHMDFSGKLLDSWALPTAPSTLHETAEGIVGLTYNTFFRARKGGSPVFVTHRLDIIPQILGDYVLFGGGTSIAVFDLSRFEGRMVELPRPWTAAYLANGTLTMETAMTRHSF